MNRWTGMGRLVRDPKVQFTNSGKCVTRFIIAINRRSNGKDYAEFVQCECWEKTAEFVGEYCGKGDKVLVEGRLHTTKYKKDGDKDSRFFTRIVVNRVEFAEKNNKQTKKMPANEPQPAPDMADGTVAPWPPVDPDQIFGDVGDDDIPF